MNTSLTVIYPVRRLISLFKWSEEWEDLTYEVKKRYQMCSTHWVLSPPKSDIYWLRISCAWCCTLWSNEGTDCHQMSLHTHYLICSPVIFFIHSLSFTRRGCFIYTFRLHLLTDWQGCQNLQNLRQSHHRNAAPKSQSATQRREESGVVQSLQKCATLECRRWALISQLHTHPGHDENGHNLWLHHLYFREVSSRHLME